MKEKSRLGTNPLEWIHDSTEETASNNSVQSKNGKPKKNQSSAGLKEGWVRATFVVRESILEQAKALAYWERKTLQNVIDEALSSGLSKKTIKPRPIEKVEE